MTTPTSKSLRHAVRAAWLLLAMLFLATDAAVAQPTFSEWTQDSIANNNWHNADNWTDGVPAQQTDIRFSRTFLNVGDYTVTIDENAFRRPRDHPPGRPAHGHGTVGRDVGLCPTSCPSP